MSVLFDVSSEKKCVVSFASNTEGVGIAGCKLGKSVYCLTVLSKNVSTAWYLEKCVVLFGSNSLKVAVMLDMNSESVYSCLVVTLWKCEYCLI